LLHTKRTGVMGGGKAELNQELADAFGLEAQIRSSGIK